MVAAVEVVVRCNGGGNDVKSCHCPCHGHKSGSAYVNENENSGICCLRQDSG